jgi:uncharacterized protein (TIGR02145 family)
MKKFYLLFAALFVCVIFFTGCKKSEFIVTFDPNGGIGNMSPQTFETGVPQPLFPNAFFYENYEFTGWSPHPNGKGKKFVNEQSITVKEDMTLFAQWLPIENTYFVFFDANGGKGTMEPQAFKGHVYQKLDSNIFTRDGYIYKGWNTKTDGSGYFCKDEATIQIDANTMLYAQWANPEGGGKPCPGTPTVNDSDGNTYKTVQIGSQCWMKENLKTTKYKTGASIPVITDNEQWWYATSGAMCYYNNDITNKTTYGALYNAYAVNTGNLCPAGWHIPSDSEWNNLANELGGNYNAGYKMKSVYGWNDYYGEDGNGDNESGFSGVPAGMRYYYDNFSSLGAVTFFWSSTNDYYQRVRILSSSNNGLGNDYESQNSGLSVRCIKD